MYATWQSQQNLNLMAQSALFRLSLTYVKCDMPLNPNTINVYYLAKSTDFEFDGIVNPVKVHVCHLAKSTDFEFDSIVNTANAY